MRLSFSVLYYIAHNLICSTYLFMFVLFEGLGSPIYRDDFQDVEVKDEPLEPDTVSSAHRVRKRSDSGVK